MSKQYTHRKQQKNPTQFTLLQWSRMSKGAQTSAAADMVAAGILGGALGIKISKKADLQRYATLLVAYLKGTCENPNVLVSSAKVGAMAAIGMTHMGWGRKKSVIERVKEKLQRFKLKRKAPKPDDA